MQTQIIKQDQTIYNEFYNKLALVETSDWVNYYKKSTSHIVQLSNGEYILFDKPTIETNFCFGYGMCLYATDKERDDAYNMYEYASTNPEYFLNQNLKDINKKIKYVENADELYSISVKNERYRLLYTKYIDKQNIDSFNEDLVYNKLTDEDRTLLLQTLYSEKLKFEKRLNTYLKKYGLTKLNVWTYLRD